MNLKNIPTGMQFMVYECEDVFMKTDRTAGDNCLVVNLSTGVIKCFDKNMTVITQD